MTVLGFDTSTAATAVGLLLDDGRAVEARDDPLPGARPRHVERLLPLADELLSGAGMGWEDVERVAVGLGPGTFTGLRIGVATARALAQSLGRPVAGVSSLRALAEGAREQAGDRPLLTAIDARRGELFAAAFRRSRMVAQPEALAPDALPAWLARAAADSGAEAWLAVGDGAIRFRSQLQAAGVVVPDDGAVVHRVSAAVVCRLGADGPPLAPEAVLPDYRRRPDAEIASSLPKDPQP